MLPRSAQTPQPHSQPAAIACITTSWTAALYPTSLIRSCGAHVGVAINPATPLQSLYEVLDSIDTVLMMTVNPGFGGQQYIPQSTAKIRTLRAYIDANGLSTQIQVDGGIALDTIATVAAAGVDDVVVGSAFFRADGDLQRSTAALQARLDA